MNTKGYILIIKIVIYFSLGLFMLLKGEETFSLPAGARKILTVLFFLFAFLRLFEGYQYYRSSKEQA